MSYCISIAQWNIRLQLVFIELIQDMKKIHLVHWCM